jgi:hypothetical protein
MPCAIILRIISKDCSNRNKPNWPHFLHIKENPQRFCLLRFKVQFTLLGTGLRINDNRRVSGTIAQVNLRLREGA